MSVLYGFEKVWLNKVLSAFFDTSKTTDTTAKVETSFAHAFETIYKSASPSAALALRFALWWLALRPVYARKRFRCLLTLTPEQRRRHLTTWLMSSSFVTRELSLMMKFVASFAWGHATHVDTAATIYTLSHPNIHTPQQPTPSTPPIRHAS